MSDLISMNFLHGIHFHFERSFVIDFHFLVFNLVLPLEGFFESFFEALLLTRSHLIKLTQHNLRFFVAHLIQEICFKMSILVLFLKLQLFNLRVFTETDVTKVVVTVKIFEHLVRLFISEWRMFHTCVLIVNNYYNASG